MANEKEKERLSNERAAALSDEDRVDAIITENFDAPTYQKSGQGGPRAGLAADEEE
ncbi:hypothetical protein [Sphingomicrobium aestuariivivum]|uniref:hypothetical protein n=1 Tax=Sphingomicrobium aestuariivivum TaxID=1582356 RepID=UPI001FD66C1A|nr:hypothetical protein [Sphingomicrobium aestuariivivum]MCJ8190340.1 hypothetical protein [Sphingomicrobium aestuariivivum]